MDVALLNLIKWIKCKKKNKLQNIRGYDILSEFSCCYIYTLIAIFHLQKIFIMLFISDNFWSELLVN